MRLNRSTTLAALLVLSLPLSVARAEDEHRELGAHVHGHGTLNIAVEKNRVVMELEAPGMDIVGFEHAARSPEQLAAVSKAKVELAKPLAMFNLPASASCTVSKAEVELETEHDDDGEDHAEHADEDGDHDEAEAGHTEFHVTYALDCAKPDNLTSITFAYFTAFAGAKELTVNVVTAKAQNTYEVSRDKPTVDLGGMM